MGNLSDIDVKFFEVDGLRKIKQIHNRVNSIVALCIPFWRDHALFLIISNHITGYLQDLRYVFNVVVHSFLLLYSRKRTDFKISDSLQVKLQVKNSRIIRKVPPSLLLQYHL